MEWTIKYEEKLEQCDARKKENTSQQVPLEILEANNISIGDAVTAISHIGSRNDYLCDEPERIRYAFALGTLDAAFKEYGISPAMEKFGIEDDSIGEVQAGLVYPSMLYFELSADYMKLSPDVQKFFEDMFGTEPFDPISVIDPLPRHQNQIGPTNKQD